MLAGAIIKTAMAKRGFRHRKADDQFTIRGQYARNLQYVYSKQYRSGRDRIVDLLYFGVDIINEKLVMGLYRENPRAENKVYINSARSIDLKEFNAKTFNRELDKLLPSVHEKLH